ncbi:MAG: hypothetical protein KKC19_02895 [Nanoarchaeota archaeon]|nr:hypothetical protein [Nanoarchaeota archaeon]
MDVKGKIINLRKHGKTVFADIYDGINRTQLMIPRVEYDEIPFNKGEFLVVCGEMTKSRKGNSVLVPSDYRTIMSPQHYVGEDFTNRRELIGKSKLLSIVRTNLIDKGFVETVTPHLLTHPGNSNIVPFETETREHTRAYLRYTLEIELKKASSRTQLPLFEIGNVFRNMGIARTHPTHEYTIVEGIWPYASLEDGMSLCESIFREAASLHGQDFSEIPCRNIKEALDSTSKTDQRTVYKKGIRLVEAPTFFSNPPYEWSPLSISNEDGTAKDSELVFRNVGLAHICEEENNYDKLLEKLGLNGNEKMRERIDPLFLEAIRSGMPPSVGFCIGIDRMLWKLREGEG